MQLVWSNQTAGSTVLRPAYPGIPGMRGSKVSKGMTSARRNPGTSAALTVGSWQTPPLIDEFPMKPSIYRFRS